MDFWIEFLAEAIKYICLIGVALGGVSLGIFLRKKKDRKARKEEE